MSTPDVLYTFTKGLPEELQVWLQHDNAQTLQDAENIVVKMSGNEPFATYNSSPTPEPMHLGSMQQTLQRATAALSRLNVAPRRPAPKRDPRKHPLWPSWACVHESQLARCRNEHKCFICFKDGHAWPDCPRLQGNRSPSATTLAEQSPSPPGSWRARPPSPGRAHPNFRGPR